MSAPLDLQDVTVEIAGRRIVEQVSLAADGEVVGLVGPNGSGKSTILRTVYRVLRPVAGRVIADGRDLWSISAREAARTTAAVVQDGPGDLELSVAEYVATGRVPHGRLLGGDTAGDRQAVAAAMASAGVEDFADRDVTTLSGGERQRVHLARALAQEPCILVLDEPTNHLDVRHQLELLELVRDLRVTTLITLHELNLAAAYCDRIVVLCEGEVVGSGTPQDVLTPELLLQVFGVRAACLTNPLTGRMNLVFSSGTQK
jgi:iron complex transport system ATP-binding protein